MSILNNISNKQILIYSAITILCVILIGVSVYFQFFYSKDRPVGLFEDVNADKSIEVETEELKLGFNNIFNNSLKKDNNGIYNIKKMQLDKEIVLTMYDIELHSENKYDINIKIPLINIDSDVAKKINKEIDDIFGRKANSIVQSKDGSNIYNLDYVAFLKGNILSLVIKSTLKEANHPQRVIIKTYNYDISTDTEVNLGTFLLKKNLNKNDVYNKVVEEIEKSISQNEALAQAGFEVFTRKKEDTRSLPENTEVFFMDLNDNLYLIYPYGNGNYTSEMDMIIF